MTTPELPAGTLPPWHVIGDQITTETTLLPGNNGLAQMHDVPYVVDGGPAKGVIRHVKVTPADFTPEAIQAAIEADLALLHPIAGLRQADAYMVG